MSFAPTSLEGRHVKLALMGLHHVDALWAAAQDPRTWEFSSAVIRNLDECRTYVETAMSWMSAGTAVPFVTMNRATNEVIGSTRFANIDRTHRRAEARSAGTDHDHVINMVDDLVGGARHAADPKAILASANRASAAPPMATMVSKMWRPMRLPSSWT